jgi:hypothetical protein
MVTVPVLGTVRLGFAEIASVTVPEAVPHEHEATPIQEALEKAVQGVFNVPLTVTWMD